MKNIFKKVDFLDFFVYLYKEDKLLKKTLKMFVYIKYFL